MSFEVHKDEVLPTDVEDRVRIIVQRKHVWDDTLHKLCNGFDTSKHLQVTFLGEPAIDDGGPMREFLRLLMGTLVGNNSLFCGDVNARLLRHNLIELNKKTFFHVGQVLALSLIHGGPSPSFFAEPVADYIMHGLKKVKACVTDVQDDVIKQSLQKVSYNVHCVIRVCA